VDEVMEEMNSETHGVFWWKPSCFTILFI